MIKTPAQNALDIRVDELLAATEYTVSRWTFAEVRDLELSSDDIAVAIAADPHELLHAFNNRYLVDHIVRELRDGNRLQGIRRLGCLLWALAEGVACKVYLEALQDEKARREDDAEEGVDDHTWHERECFAPRSA